ncbi:Gag-Pol polyprotein, partial [Mucuna pruriens]
MCDTSNSTLGVILGQQVSKQPHVIAYASRTMDPAQANYTTTEKELLEIILQLEHVTPWYVDICNFLIASMFPPGACKTYKDKLGSEVKYYIWDDPYLWRICNDQVMHRCRDLVSPPLLTFSSRRRLLWIQSDNLKSLQLYAILAHHFSRLLRWVEDKATNTNEDKVVVEFLKSNIFYRFGVSKVLISEQGSHFYNCAMATLLKKYEVVHRISTAYHPQTNGQAEVFNREIKKLLQKMANPNQNDWSRLLEDTLWAHRISYRTLLGMFPYRIVFGKACHLPVEIKHQEY